MYKIYDVVNDYLIDKYELFNFNKNWAEALSSVGYDVEKEFEVVKPLSWIENTITMGMESLYYVAPELIGFIDDYGSSLIKLSTSLTGSGSGTAL
ncbi:MAG: hypothetical protein QW290_08195 [Sulfolobales archaeon]